jgi:nucleotide-binding universal stress UspA family protein
VSSWHIACLWIDEEGAGYARRVDPMTMYTTILCPTDLSPGADSALRTAAGLAHTHGAKLIVFYCQTEAVKGGMSPDRARRGVRGLFEESIAFNASPDIVHALRWEGVVRSAPDAGEAIVREAAEQGVDLIVMGSRRRPLAAALLGSTAEAVCRTAPCPVLVTHRDERTWIPGEGHTPKVLVAYDFWDDSERALQYAIGFARENGAELHILHAISAPEDDSPEVAWSSVGSGSQIARIERRLDRVVPQAARRDLRIFPHVSMGAPYREILAFAEDHAIDLVCMGSRGRDFGARSLFGSNTDRVLRQSPCPILIARPLRPALSHAGSGIQRPVRPLEDQESRERRTRSASTV